MLPARPLKILAASAVWMLTAMSLWAFMFTHDQRSMVLGGHDVVVTPTFTGYAVLRMGPYVPDVRIPTGSRIGVSIVVNKTTATSTQSLVERYALMASQPQPEIRRVADQLRSMALDDAVRAGVLGLAPIGLWLLVGSERRHRLRQLPPRTVLTTGVVLAVLAVALWEPWHQAPEQGEKVIWLPLQSALPGVSVPAELDTVQVEGGLITSETEYLVRSALRVFAESKTYYRDLADRVATVADRIHQPVGGETVGVLISDRHDNIGMDQVAVAIARAGKATVVIDAGDDTSSGGSWESFSLESLVDAFRDFPVRLFVAGNHDNGGFVTSYLKKAGWTHLDGKVVTPFAGVRVLGVDDPRANGLVDPADTRQQDFLKVTDELSSAICKANDDGDRIATVVVHSVSMAMPALTRGCTDLVVGGHLHVQVGPDRIIGENGSVGYGYTNGTTGGAAYSFALGSSLHHPAEVTLVTWRDGLPVGIQPVFIDTKAQIFVRPYVSLDLRQAPAGPPHLLGEHSERGHGRPGNGAA